MMKIKRVVFCGVVAACVISCQRSDGTAKQLRDIRGRLDKIDAKLDRLGRARAGAVAARAPRPRRPDPNTVYAVPVHKNDPHVGGAHAKVTLVEAYDFSCPYCAMLHPTIQALTDHYPRTDLEVVTKQLVVHPQLGTQPALAGCAANAQGGFPAFQKALWTRAWKLTPRPSLNRGALTTDALVKLAGTVGLNRRRFRADMTGAKCKRWLSSTRLELGRLGVNSTPTVYINGKPYDGPRTLKALRKVIDAEIAKANAALNSGTKLEDYYATITTHGKKTL